MTVDSRAKAPEARNRGFLYLAVFSAIGITSVFGLTFVFRGPGGDGVLARLQLPDGADVLVTQKWNGWSEPYTVDFFYRKNGDAWTWNYIDHEAVRWRNVRLSYDSASDVLSVSNSGKTVAVLDRPIDEFRLLQGGRWSPRKAAVEYREPVW